MFNGEINPTSTSFVLDGPDMPDLRWQYADEALGMRKRAYKADEWSGIEWRGIVMFLPNRRGYIAGFTEGLYSNVDYDIYDNIRDASIAADNLARAACERDIEFQAMVEEECQNEVEEL